MKDVAAKFDDCFVLDINTFGFDWPTLGVSYGYQTTTDSSHPTRLGHVYLSDQFNTYLDWVIGNNQKAFFKTVYINTPWEPE